MNCQNKHLTELYYLVGNQAIEEDKEKETEKKINNNLEKNDKMKPIQRAKIYGKRKRKKQKEIAPIFTQPV